MSWRGHHERGVRIVGIYRPAVPIASFIGPGIGGIIISMISTMGLLFISGAAGFGIRLAFIGLIARDERTEGNS